VVQKSKLGKILESLNILVGKKFILFKISLFENFNFFKYFTVSGIRYFYNFTIEFEGKHFEAGGSIIHPANKHAINIMNEYGLKRKTTGSSIPGIIGGLEKTGNAKWNFLPTGAIFDSLSFAYQYGLDAVFLEYQKYK